MLTRRNLIRVSAATFTAAIAPLPRLAFAAVPGDRRLVLVILRGGMDGLSAVPPMRTETTPGCAAAWPWASLGGMGAPWIWMAGSACTRPWRPCMGFMGPAS